MPERRAFWPRWAVTAARIAAWIAESHGHDSDAFFVIERVVIDTEPLAQPFTAGVIPRNAGFMHLGSGRLTDD